MIPWLCVQALSVTWVLCAGDVGSGSGICILALADGAGSAACAPQGILVSHCHGPISRYDAVALLHMSSLCAREWFAVQGVWGVKARCNELDLRHSELEELDEMSSEGGSCLGHNTE